MPQSTLALLCAALPSTRPIVLHEPWFTAADTQAVANAVQTGWVSSVSPQVRQFEKALESLAPNMTAVATHSGTTALFLALRALGCSSGCEVLLPSLTYVATANAICRTGATPHFYDVQPCHPSTAAGLSATAQQLAVYLSQVSERKNGVTRNRHTGQKIQALVAVHPLGFAAESLAEICEQWHLAYIEDTAGALGATYAGGAARADACIYSFNGNKIVTTGGGGAVLFRQPELADNARHYSQQAKIPHPTAMLHDQVGDNLLLSGLNAALGISQLQRLDQILERHQQVHQRWLDLRPALNKQGWEVLSTSTDRSAVSNHWLTGLVSTAKDPQVHALTELARQSQVFLRPLPQPLHQLPMFKSCPRADTMAHTEAWAERVICLPSSATLLAEALAA